MSNSIGGNIISSLGAGSGLNSSSLVDQLTEVERAPRQQRIDTKRETLEAQISDFGLIRSAMSTLQDSAKSLADSATFNSKSASFSDSDAFVPVSLSEEVPVGNYAFEVLGVAASQSLVTGAAVQDPTEAIGKGSLTLDFGSWDTAQPPTTFTPSGEKDSLVIDLDDTNNSLNGLRDAINEADAGVTASIVNTGNGYQLLLSAESGESNQLQITAIEEAGAEGLANFNFNTNDQALSQMQAGKDARLKLNGLEITRSTNNIDDVLDGFEFNLAKADPGNIVNVSVTEDKAGGQEAVRAFVDSYNTFLETIEPAVGYDAENDENGSLQRDPTASSIVSQMRNLIASGVGGIEDGFTALTNVGIRTERDGTLSIDEEDFSKAFNENYDLVRQLFSPQADSSSDKIAVSSYRTQQAVPGSYEVNITQQPAKGLLTGVAAAGTLLADLDAASSSGFFTGAASNFAATDLATQGVAEGAYAFDIAVDGGDAITVALPIADYADESGMAAALQAEFDGLGIEADITHNGTGFVINSRSNGSDSGVAISNVVEPAAGEFGLAAGTATGGTGPNAGDYDFEITVNGVKSDTIAVNLGSYGSQEELALHLQSQINGDSKLKASGAQVDVSWNGDHFEIQSRAYGSKSRVNVTPLGASAADLGLDSGTRTSGKDVAGTIDGVAGFGLGDVLLPKLDSDPYGINLQVKPGATSSTVNFSRGFGTELSQLIDGYLQKNGILDKREESLEGKLGDLEDDEDQLNTRMDAFYERQLAQFMAMERIVNSLNSSGSALDNIGDRLPFTANNGR